MKFIAFSDSHFHPHNVGATMLEGGMNSRLMDVGDAVREVYQYAKDNDIDHVVFGGDLFHTKKNVDVAAFNLAWKIIKSEAGDIKTLMIPGNHDIASPDGAQTSLEAFDGGNVSVFSKPGVSFLYDPADASNNCFLCFAPFPAVNGKFNRDKFFSNIETIKKKIERLEKESLTDAQKILVTHAYTNELMGRHHGLDGDISVAELTEYFDLILLGHHHVFDTVETPGAGVRAISLGCVLPLTFADTTPRGFTVIDTEKDPLFQFVGTSAPEFLPGVDPDYILKEKDHLFENAIIRVRVKSKAEAKAVEKKLIKAKARDWSIEIGESPAAGSVRLEMGDSLKTNEILDSYMKSDWGKTELDPKKLLKRGLSLIEGR